MRELSDLNRLILDSEAQLLRYAGRYLRDREAARDAVQEAFIRFVRVSQNPKAEGVENVPAWLFRTTRNICLDVLKSKRMKVEIRLEEGFEGPHEGSPAPDREASKKDEMEMLGRLVEGLEPREREALSLKIEHGKSYREIAAILDLSVSNVGVILHNALQKMRKAYRAMNDGTPIATESAVAAGE